MLCKELLLISRIYHVECELCRLMWLKMWLSLVTFKDVFVSIMLWKLQSSDSESQVTEFTSAALLETPVAFVSQAACVLHVISPQIWHQPRQHAVHEELWEIRQAHPLFPVFRKLP